MTTLLKGRKTEVDGPDYLKKEPMTKRLLSGEKAKVRRAAVGSIALLMMVLAIFTPLTVSAATQPVTVSISAKVTDSIDFTPSCTLAIHAGASGASLASVSGQGVDNAQCIGAPSQLAKPGLECLWSLTGSVSGGVVTLSGTVFQSSDRNGEVGTPVTIIADASTGSVTWNFGPQTWTGIGTVAIS